MRVLITGISAAGKSTIVRELKSRGFYAIDVDSETEIAGSTNIHTRKRETVPSPRPVNWRAYHQWLWDENQLIKYLETAPIDFVLSGNAENQTRFYNYFDKVFVLAIDNKTLEYRLLTRKNNSYGKHPRELTDSLKYNEKFTSEAIEAGAKRVDATQPPDKVADEILSYVSK